MEAVANSINGFRVNMEVGGYPLNFQRRRYGKKMFTWVSFFDGSEWISLGDPWPSIMVSTSEILDAIKQRLAVKDNYRK